MFAEVIVDISNSEVDRIFEYSHFDMPQLRTGMRVLVPFGSRQIEGYVIKLKEKSDYDVQKIKQISSILDTMPVISQEMLSLSEFMVEKYHLRMVDVLRLFIPSNMRGGKVKELTKQYASISKDYIGVDTSEFIKKSATAQLEVFNHILANPESSVTELNQNFSASALRNLIARDVIAVTTKEVLRTPYNGLSGESKRVTLTDDQQKVVNKILSTSGKTFLLHGVTGSGKTEVYMHCIASVLAENKTAIMLVPEISLTPQVLKNFRSKFGNRVALLHSGLSAGERFDEWRRLLGGDATVAIGARSAIFAPLKNVGIIIIDEEHDSSYTSESNPRYSTAEVSEFRKKFNKCNLILGSATPSIESYQKAKISEYDLLEMPSRVNKKPMPHTEIINMCDEVYNGNNTFLSRLLHAELDECIASGNQAMVFINRRGYSSYVICKSCGHVPKCDSCDVSLVYHKEDNALKCHYCNARYAKLDLCPECKSPHIRQGYVGTQAVCEHLQKLFPDKVILRMDNDTTQSKDSHIKILNEFSGGRASILVGTQMIAKGHDFPNVTLVGILDADMSLYFSDYRSIERTYQLITQVSGRAGRDNKSGKVVLQTYTPNHYVYKFAVNNNYRGFFEKECNLREVTKYPPFSKIIRILVSSESEELASNTLKSIFDKITELSKKHPDNFAYFSAMRSPVKRIQNKHRMQVLIRITGEYDAITNSLFEIVDKHLNPKISCFIEQNPNSLS